MNPAAASIFFPRFVPHQATVPGAAALKYRLTTVVKPNFLEKWGAVAPSSKEKRAGEPYPGALGLSRLGLSANYWAASTFLSDGFGTCQIRPESSAACGKNCVDLFPEGSSTISARRL